MKKAVAYARFSSSMQREESIDAQMRAITDYCTKNDIVLLGRYIDMAQSATTDDRPEFRRMIDESSEKEYDYIIVHKLDRFARNRYDSAIYNKKIEANGKKLLSVLETFGEGPEAIIFRSIIEGFNEYYSKNLARETRKGQRENAYKALFNGGTPPLGYTIDSENRYTINPREAEAVKLIFDMYVSGYPYADIIDALHAQGYRTKKGKHFKKTSLFEILKQEKYIGRYIFGREDYRPGEKRNSHRYRKEEDMIILDDAMPSIIDKETWNMAQARRSAQKKNPNPRKGTKREGGYPLTGHIVCKKCGSPMVGTSRIGGSGKRYYYYECTKHKRKECNARSIRADKIESLLMDALDDYLFKHGYIENLIDALFDYLTTDEDPSAEEKERALKAKIRETDEQIENLTNAIAGGSRLQSLLDKLTELEKEKTILASSLRKLSFKQAHTALKRETVERFMRKYDSIKKYDQHERLQILSIFIDRIEVDSPKIYVSFNIREPLNGAEKGT